MTTGRINQVLQTLAVRPFLGHVLGREPMVTWLRRWSSERRFGGSIPFWRADVLETGNMGGD